MSKNNFTKSYAYYKAQGMRRYSLLNQEIDFVVIRNSVVFGEFDGACYTQKFRLN